MEGVGCVEKMKMPNRAFLLLAAVLVLFGVIFSAGCGNSKTTSQEKAKEVPLEEYIRDIPQLKGNLPGTQKPRLKGLIVNNAGVIINYYPDVNGTVDKNFVYKNYRDLLKPFGKRHDFMKVYVNQWVTEKDSNGNEIDKPIGDIQISQEKLNNINFSNFDYTTWPDIADVWDLDPSIDK